MNMFFVSKTNGFFLLIVIYWQCLCTVFLPKVVAQDYVDECPEPNGFYADAVQCDRYYECKNSQISDKLCPDGLVFDETSIHFAKCSFPFSIDCADRAELQKAPHPTEQCPRKNGYFPHEDKTVCDKFYFCVDGIANKLSCPESLIFNPENGQCSYSDQVNREGCSSLEFFKFKCPHDPTNAHAHPRYSDPTDCQYFFLCLDGKDARRNGCQTGLVFNQKTSSCDRQENLAANDECRGYYNETFLEGLRGGSSRLPHISGRPNTGTGIKLDTNNRKRVSVVRRKKPRPQQNIQSPVSVQQPARRRPQNGVAGSVTGSLENRRVPADPRVRAQQASLNLQNKVEDRRVSPPVRTRVRRPNLPGFASQQETVEPAGPPAPPQFSLSDAEAIQRFRDSNRFAPENSRPSTRDSASGSTGGGRLTVLSANNFRRRNPADNSESVLQQQPEDDPKSGFGSFSAVPDTPSNNFGNRFRSRRPPTFQDATPANQEVKSLPVRRTVGGSSERIQVTKIDIKPQFDLAAEVGEALDRQEGVGRTEDEGGQFTSFPDFESGRQRSRGQQG